MTPRLGDVSPVNTRDDSLDCRLADAEPGSHVGAGRYVGKGADMSHIGFGKDGAPVHLSAPIFRRGEPLSPLGDHVRDVVGVGAKKQMFRVYAAWIVAGMAYKLAPWLDATVQPIANSMRVDGASAIGTGEHTVPLAADSGGPMPTADSLVHLAPETGDVSLVHRQQSSTIPLEAARLERIEQLKEE